MSSEERSPLISVLMPVYNCLPFLDEAIWSVRRQTFSDFECLLVNDGSRDDSMAVMKNHAAEDPRFIIIDKQNGGIVSALNAGLAKVRGTFIARMDGDDLCLPDRFQQQLEYLQSHPEVGLVGGWAKVIDEHGEPVENCACSVKELCWCSIIRLPESHEEINGGLSKGVYTLLHPTIMIRASLMTQLYGYDSHYLIAEDLDLMLRAGEVSRLANLQEVVLRYRRRKSSQTQNWASETPKWNAKALLAARARGRIISRETLATTCEQMSWKKANQAEYRVSLAYGLRAFMTAPFSIIGVRAIIRALVRMLKGVCS